MIMTEQEYINKVKEIELAYQRKMDELTVEWKDSETCVFISWVQDWAYDQFINACKQLDKLGVTILFPKDQSNPNAYAVNTVCKGDIRILPSNHKLEDVGYNNAVSKLDFQKKGLCFDKTYIPIELFDNNDIMYYTSAFSSIKPSWPE